MLDGSRGSPTVTAPLDIGKVVADPPKFGLCGISSSPEYGSACASEKGGSPIVTAPLAAGLPVATDYGGAFGVVPEQLRQSNLGATALGETTGLKYTLAGYLKTKGSLVYKINLTVGDPNTNITYFIHKSDCGCYPPFHFISKKMNFIH